MTLPRTPQINVIVPPYQPMVEVEELNAQILNPYQIKRIQNEIAMITASILNLQLDTSKPLEHLQEDSYWKGQLAFAQLLLDTHTSAQQTLAEKAKEQSHE